MRPLVTIGIPVYNTEKYIEKAICSALNQSFNLPYEICVVDDRSTDNSVHIINQIISIHNRGKIIRIISHNTNLGIGEARATIIENALGKYIFFLDSDDWMDENALMVLFTKAEETNAELVVADVTHVYDDSLWQRTHYEERYINHIGAGAYAISHKIEDIHQEWWAKLWNVEFLRRTHLFNNFRVLEDILPHFKMCAEATKIAWVSYAVYYYRIRPNSIMTGQFYEKKQQMINAYNETIREASQLLQNNYYNIDGIYDMFVDRIRDAIINIAKIPIPDPEKRAIGTYIYNFARIIPNLKALNNKQNRLAYFLCRKTFKCYRIECTFILTPNKFWGRVLRNILAII